MIVLKKNTVKYRNKKFYLTIKDLELMKFIELLLINLRAVVKINGNIITFNTNNGSCRISTEDILALFVQAGFIEETV